MCCKWFEFASYI